LLSRPNGQEGVLISGSPQNMVGGTNAADRNVLSGNVDAGVYLLNTSGNTVLGNYIGTTVSGATSLANANNGIVVYNSRSNLIGGATTAARNVISGNVGSGIYLFGSSANYVQGNYIGVDVSGALALANGVDGISLAGAAGNTLGGTNSGEGNVISGNSKGGIFFNGSGVESNVVQGNYIGTDSSGRTALGNTLGGVTFSGANSNMVGGLVAAARNIIAGNKQDGIFITNSSGNVVQGNFIGVDVTGAGALSNFFNGISISAAASNTIGGSAVGARNVISGNGNYGIQIYNAGSSGNAVQGNFIGCNANGSGAVANQLSGVRIESAGNTIGGAGAGNVISGNGQDGIFLVGTSATGNVIQGNFIGTAATGSSGVGNGRAGVGVSGAPGNSITGNLLSANGDAGIYLISNGATGNHVQGNTIGTDITGMNGLGNTFEGLYVERAPSNTIGGIVLGAGNLISANHTRGIWFTNAPWSVLQGNTIGTKADGSSSLGNTFHNVECEAGANNTTIGGTAAGAGNRIAFAQSIYAGVRIRAGSANNAILGNSIFSNGALGIDLGNVGINANVSCDTSPGANMLQNFPVLTQAVSGESTVIRGTLNSRPNTSFLLQFFASPTCDPSGNGEGQIYLADKSVVTSNNCNTSFAATLPVQVPPGYVITATATDPANNTSEFSACLPIISVPTLALTTAGSTNVNLSWTNNGTTFFLKETQSLFSPIQWTTVTNTPVLNNGQFIVTLPLSGTSRFFLLSYEY